MGMTHYMELMMSSWHLLVLFMAVPMLLAECYVVSEILLLLKPRESGALKTFDKASAYAAALVIAALSAYAAVWFSRVVQWRTWVDVTAAVAYVAAGLPFLYVAALEAGITGRGWNAVKKVHAAVAAVVAYLILSHAAMVFGMFDPLQFGWPGAGHNMHAMPAEHAGHALPHDAMMSHAMPQEPVAESRGPHCSGMPQDLSGMKLPEGHPVPEGYHRMPDGRLMRHGEPMKTPEENAAAGHHCQ